RKQGPTNYDSNIRPSVVKAFLKGVAYLDDLTRKDYTVTFDGATAMWRGAPFDTSSMKTVFSSIGFAIWVISKEGEMYAGNHVFGEFHHSSFLAGGDVRCGGEVKASNGTIEFLSAKSGHYRPELENLIWAVDALDCQGVDVEKMRVAVWQPPKADVILMKGDNLYYDTYRKGYGAWGHMSADELGRLRLGQYDTFPTA